MAKLHFKYGAMNSGKSDTLIKTAYNYEERGLSIMVIKPAIDTKDKTAIIARGGARREADVLSLATTDIREAYLRHTTQKKLAKLHAILVDEAQFLEPHQIDQLFSLAKEDGVSVIAYGLRSDFRTQQFPASKRLFELADNIEKLPTMCICGSQAEFNCRSIDGTPVFDGDQVAIDGEGVVTYISLCGTCYMREKRKQEKVAL
jgi:thymidine kinase